MNAHEFAEAVEPILDIALHGGTSDEFAAALFAEIERLSAGSPDIREILPAECAAAEAFGRIFPELLP
jgi:hypothetical protein